jgi:hypothetical protein
MAMNEQIESLAFAKGYSELTAEEKSFVLESMSAVEYNGLRHTLLTISRIGADEQPPAELRARLLRHLADQKQTHALIRWTKIPVPLWAVAASYLTLTLAFWFVHNAEPPQPAPVQTIVKRDTVWAERVVWREKVIWKTRTLAVLSNPIAAVDSIGNMFPDEEPSVGPKGTPLSEISEWLNVFSSADK